MHAADFLLPVKLPHPGLAIGQQERFLLNLFPVVDSPAVHIFGDDFVNGDCAA